MRSQFAIVSDRNGERRPGVFSSAAEKLNLLLDGILDDSLGR